MPHCNHGGAGSAATLPGAWRAVETGGPLETPLALGAVCASGTTGAFRADLTLGTALACGAVCAGGRGGGIREHSMGSADELH